MADIRAYSNILLVLDDLMSDMVSLSSGLFTKHVHHQNLSISYNVQNIFNNAKSHRTLSLNANYIVLFKNPWKLRCQTWHDKCFLENQKYSKKHLTMQL